MTNDPLLSAKAILFDVDGTIAETERDGHLVAFNAAFKAFGLPWQWSTETYGRLLKVTGGYERMRAYAEGMQDPEASVTWDEALFRRIHHWKNDYYATLLKNGGIQPRWGFVSLVQQALARGQQWAVVTTTSQSNWAALWEHAILRNSGLPAPSVIICGEQVAKKKPDPEAYLLALEQLQLSTGDCIAIEDSRNGLTAASGAGIPTVIVRSEYFRQDDFSGAVRVVDELTELLTA